MVAAATTALSATADGNQRKPGFPGFIPPGATPQQAAAALAAPLPMLAGTGLGMGDPMNKMPPLAPAVGGGLAPAFGSGLWLCATTHPDDSQNVRAVCRADNDKPFSQACRQMTNSARPLLLCCGSCQCELTESQLAQALLPRQVPQRLPQQYNLACQRRRGRNPNRRTEGWKGGPPRSSTKDCFGDLRATIKTRLKRLCGVLLSRRNHQRQRHRSKHRRKPHPAMRAATTQQATVRKVQR